MEPSVVAFFDAVQSTAFTFSLWAFVALNGVALAAILVTRSRAVVQRWTSPWLALNLLLLGTGAGIPLVAGICKSIASAVGSAIVAQQPAPSID